MTINTTTLLGHLTKDPILRLLPSGICVANFTIACNWRARTDAGQVHEEVAFVPCTAFGPWALRVQGAKKGAMAIVSGRLRTESWEQDNVRRDRLILICATVQPVQALRLEPGEAASAPTGPTSTSEKDEVPF